MLVRGLSSVRHVSLALPRARELTRSMRRGPLSQQRSQSTVAPETYAMESLAVSSPAANVLHVELNTPATMNAFGEAMWRDVRHVFEQVR
jgi:hypothetical protein